MNDVTIGVLALQGAVREHLNLLRACGVKAVAVKKVHELADLDGLIIPGGESTTIGQLMEEFGFFPAIRDFASRGKPVYGTCAGMILLAKEIAESAQPRLGFIDMVAQRNGFGRQRESFETDLEIPPLGEKPVRAVFIRAPYIDSVKPGVEVLATYQGKIVAARQAQFLASAFHPELTEDARFHQYFVDMVRAARRSP
jgi:5'-phosphate synthase pdxT subunit